MRYEWDEAKNLRNQRKHGGISFEMATLVFEDPNCLIYPDRNDPESGEQRWHALGVAQIEARARAVLLVVHAYKEVIHEQTVVRIISARAAEKHEIRRYQKQEMD